MVQNAIQVSHVDQGIFWGRAFAEAIASLTGRAPQINESEVAQYAAIAMKQKGMGYNIRPVQLDDLEEFLRKI